MRSRKLNHVIAFDDLPFRRTHRGDVGIVGVVFAGPRFDGVVSGRIRRDGANAAREGIAADEFADLEPQALMDRELFRQLFSARRRFGDAALRAKAATSDLDVKRTWILFGDPSMRMKSQDIAR